MTPPRIRVCSLLGLYPPDFSGHGILWEQLLPQLEAHGVAADVVVRRPFSEVTWRAAEDPRVKRLRPAPGEPGAALRGAWRLRGFLRRHRRDYDLIHTTCFGPEFFLVLPTLRRLGLPWILEMTLIGSDDPLTIRGQRLGGLKLALLRDADRWIGVSDAFRPLLAEAGIPEERFRCLHPGIDLERFRPPGEDERRAARASLDVPPEARVVVSVGSLMARKGMDRLARAWARTGPRPGRDLLLLVGPASVAEGLRAEHLPHVRELEALAARPELAGTIRITGRSDDVERWLAASDVFALLSRREGFGTVTAEAMACGLPCLVSSLDGIGREIVDEGRTGHVFDEPVDEAAVAEHLRALLDDPGRLRALGAEAARTARERYSIAARAGTLRGIYDELLERA